MLGIKQPFGLILPLDNKAFIITAITVSNPDQLKDIVLDVLRENPDILKAAIKELLAPEAEETPEARRERIRALIQDDFDQHEDVFKALA